MNERLLRVVSEVTRIFSGLYIQGIEVSQVTQYYNSSRFLKNPADQREDNAIRLVANKAALVRVYLRTGAEFGQIPDVTGTLDVSGVFKTVTLSPLKTSSSGSGSGGGGGGTGGGTGAGGGLGGGTTNDLEGGGYGGDDPEEDNPPAPPAPPSDLVTVVAKQDDVVDHMDERRRLSHTLNFILPAHLMHGQIRLHIKVEAPGGHSAQRKFFFDVTLRQTLRLRGIMVSYQGKKSHSSSPSAPPIDLPAPKLQDLVNLSPTALAMFPVERRGEYSSAGQLHWEVPLDDPIAPPATLYSPNTIAFQAALYKHILVDGNHPSFLYYALTPAGMSHGTKWIGFGNSDSEVPAQPYDPYKPYGLSDPYDPSRVYEPALACGPVRDSSEDVHAIMAHELGHSCQLEHAPCGNPTPPNIDPNYPSYTPYPPGSIGTFGVDMRPAVPEIMLPDSIGSGTGSTDIMSYCTTKRWISPYNYTKLLFNSRLHPRSWFTEWQRPKLPPLIRQPVIAVIGIMKSVDEIEIQTVARAKTSSPLPAGKSTGLVAELVGRSGQVVSHSEIMALSLSPFGKGCGCCQANESPYPRVIHAYIPAPERGASLRIRQGEKELWARSAPTQPVRIIEWRARVTTERQSAGAIRINVRWKAAPDRNPNMEAWIQWSNDRGRTWHALVTGLRKTTATIDADQIPSGPFSLRLTVNDGFHTAESKSISLRIPVRDPILTVFTPAEGEKLQAGVPMHLWAAVASRDIDVPPREKIEWLLDGKKVGDGIDAFITAPSPGSHSVTASLSVGSRKIKHIVKFKTTKRAP